MAQWNDLTQDERDAVNNWMNQLIRPIAGEFARTLYHLDIAKTDYDSQVGAILTQLDASAVVPNESGLAGAVPLTKAQLTPMLSALAALLAGYYDSAHKELWLKLAGAANIIGG